MLAEHRQIRKMMYRRIPVLGPQLQVLTQQVPLRRALQMILQVQKQAVVGQVEQLRRERE